MRVLPTKFDACFQVVLPDGRGFNVFYEEFESVMDELVVDFGIDRILDSSITVVPIDRTEPKLFSVEVGAKYLKG